MPQNNDSGDSSGCLHSTAAIIGAIAALVTAIAGLIVALNGSGGTSNGNGGTSNGNGVYNPPPKQFATTCVTSFGSCQMMQPLQQGSVCTCYNNFGMPISSGVAQ